MNKLWWPMIGNFNHLHPEYEVLDWRGKSYFVDLAWLPGYMKLIFEIKGFGPHVRDMDRKQFQEENCRETFLQGIGYHVVSFAYDDIVERPELCMTLLRLILGRFGHEAFGGNELRLNRHEREAVLFAVRLARPVRPIELVKELEMDHRTAVKLLQALVGQGWFIPLRGNEDARIRRYELVMDKVSRYRW